MESVWRSQEDYSHGYLILPLAAILLWLRWDSFPGVSQHVDWRGLVLMLLAVVTRWLAAMAYMDFIDGWSLILMILGLTWLLFGWPVLRWSAPAIIFLIMMVRLPFQAESLLSWHLQNIATKLSTVILVVLGLPAVREGNTIWLGQEQLFVEEACSGMRIFVGMFALAFFWCVTAQRSWIDRIIIFAAAIPLALFVNATRIVLIGLLLDPSNSESTNQQIHDWTGLITIPLAGLLLWIVKVSWEKIYRPVEIVNPVFDLRTSVQSTTGGR